MGCAPVHWVGGALTVTGKEQRATARPSVRRVVADGGNLTPICTATEF